MLKGLGLWIAFEQNLGKDKKEALKNAIEKCRMAGAAWVAPRLCVGGQADAAFDERTVQAFVEEGLTVAVWPFVTAGQPTELRHLERAAKMGVTHTILNAEFDFLQKASDSDAERLVQGARELGYEFVAHAPPDYAGSRGDGPLAKLDEICDAIMPQIYPFEHDDSGCLYHINRVIPAYEKRGFSKNKVWPIFSTYRPKTRGKYIVPKMTNEGAVVTSDVITAINYCLEKLFPVFSLYSIEATFNGVWPALLAMDKDFFAAGIPQYTLSQLFAPPDWEPQTDAETATNGLVHRCIENFQAEESHEKYQWIE